jgi:hypothetical protein
MPEYHNHYPQRYPRYGRRGPMSFRREQPGDYYNTPGRDIYVDDENMSGRMTPMGYDYRDDDYDYHYDAHGPDWQYDTDNDYGLYSPDREYDYGGHGASGYGGPYFGRPFGFARRQQAIDRRFRPEPGRYGRQEVYPMNFGDHRGHFPNPRFNGRNYGPPMGPQDNRNYDSIPHERIYYHDPRGRRW